MAIGDLVGDLATAYLTPAQRAAQAKGVQSLTGGPIARASQQIPAAAGLAAAAPALAGQVAQTAPAPASLELLSPGSGAAAPVAAPVQPLSLASLAPAASVSFPTTPQTGQAVASPPAAPAAPATLDNAYRPTGIGAGSNAIAARTGANGVPEFSNLPADLASAGGRAPVAIAAQQPTSLAQLAPGGSVTPSPTASLASLGSVANLGDGVGTFSQANAGDGQLAMTRFQKAADLRDGYKAQDRLQEAVAAQARDRNFNVVRDSAQPLTRRELKFDQDRATTTQGLADAAKGSQSLVDGQRQGVAAGLQQRQASRLEDALVAASSPNATAEQKQRYQSLVDPTGANAVKAQQSQAQLSNTQLEGQLKQQQIAQNAQTQQQATQDRTRSQAGQVATIDQALGSVDSLLGTKVDPKNPTGKRLDEDPGLESSVGFTSIFPTRPGSASADFEAKLDTLKAQSFLPQVALLKGAGALSDAEGKKLSDSIGALSPKMSEEAFRKSLGEIRSTFAASRDRLSASGGAPQPAGAAPTATPAVAQASIPTITSKAQADALPAGSVFIGPDGKQYRK